MTELGILGSYLHELLCDCHLLQPLQIGCLLVMRQCQLNSATHAAFGCAIATATIAETAGRFMVD